VASTQDIKRRIRSVKNTRKITKAMELVAAAKLRRAEQRIGVLRPYAERMRELMIGTARATRSRRFALLQVRDVRAVAVLPLTGDRGLAGSTPRSCGGPSRSRARHGTRVRRSAGSSWARRGARL
jgi:F-type H+-transporting ATPase subunit gamma